MTKIHKSMTLGREVQILEAFFCFCFLVSFMFHVAEFGTNFRFELQPGVKPKIGSGDRDQMITGLLQNLSLEGVGPRWIRPLPPRLPIQEGEVRSV